MMRRAASAASYSYTAAAAAAAVAAANPTRTRPRRGMASQSSSSLSFRSVHSAASPRQRHIASSLSSCYPAASRICARKSSSSSSSSLPSPSSGRSTGHLVPSASNENENENETNSALSSSVSQSVPIDFMTSSKITGQESQVLEVVLRPGNVLRAESGAMLYMTSGIQMDSTLAEGGLSSGLGRMLTGQNLFLADYTFDESSAYGGASSDQDGEGAAAGAGTGAGAGAGAGAGRKKNTKSKKETPSPVRAGTVALGTDFPSKIVRLNLDEYGGKLVCQKGAYLASDGNSVDIQMEFAKKFAAGFFGGEGFVLQALVGQGDVFVKAGGTLVKRVLKQGETLRVSSGCLVAFTKDVEFDVQMMAGFKNVMFGGEGLFVTTLTGPGTVWLQGMPPDRMISEIARRVPSGGGIGLGVPIGGGGGGDGTADGEGGGIEGVDDDGGAAAAAAVGGGGEDAVAATDAAVEADRQATVASSGAAGAGGGGGGSGGGGGIDADSPEALFGDAAPPGGTGAGGGTGGGDAAGSDSATTTSTTSSSSSSFGADEDVDFGDDVASQENFFGGDGDGDGDVSFDDQTDFSTYDDEQQWQNENEMAEDEFGTDLDDVGAEEGGEGVEGEEGPSLFRQLWDLFSGDDDD